MDQPSDWDLLRQYATQNSEPAFTALVQRNINLVHSAASRQVHDPHLAEDVTQAVFIALARKAHLFRKRTCLCAWLYRATSFASSNVLKAKRRREKREQKVAQMAAETPDADPAWEQISPILDEAMSRLRQKDRTAVLLRYFENKTLAEVGAALGISEDAARKRVARALEKLRALFSRRGASLSGVAIATLFSARASETAPSALETSTATVASASTAYAPVTLLGIAKATLRTMGWVNSRTVAITVMGIGVVAAMAFLMATSSHRGSAPKNSTYEFEVSGEIQRTQYFSRPPPGVAPSEPKAEAAEFTVSVRNSNWFIHLVRKDEPNKYLDASNDGKAMYA